jgi:hypothetical protein
MIVNLQPTAKELEDLRSITQNNLDNICEYTGEDTLAYELPFLQQEFGLALQIKNLLLTPDSETQELTLNNEV